jgi:hypothetical protein
MPSFAAVLLVVFSLHAAASAQQSGEAKPAPAVNRAAKKPQAASSNEAKPEQDRPGEVYERQPGPCRAQGLGRRFRGDRRARADD